MDIEKEINEIIGQPESSKLEYKAVLPPSKNIAQIISSFANTEGGYIILGVSDNLEVNGLSEDFHANAITHKALDLLSPQPRVYYQYVISKGKKLYAIKVEKSNVPITLESKIYIRDGAISKQSNPPEIKFKTDGYERIKIINHQLQSWKAKATNSQIKVLEHYQSILRIIDDLGLILYPVNPQVSTLNPEGKILTRILFSSFVDNFETYLSDLLFEIFLANPNTLKSRQQVTIEEVLNCSDLQEFVEYWAKQKIGTLQKGSVKGFVSDNRQIRDLEVLDAFTILEIEKILQIRHLYSHRNGVVDEKFLQYFSGQFAINTEHQMSISEICDKLCYLSEMINQIDVKAKLKYNLASGS
jgi:hypothetical protein